LIISFIDEKDSCVCGGIFHLVESWAGLIISFIDEKNGVCVFLPDKSSVATSARLCRLIVIVIIESRFIVFLYLQREAIIPRFLCVSGVSCAEP